MLKWDICSRPMVATSPQDIDRVAENVMPIDYSL